MPSADINDHNDGTFPDVSGAPKVIESLPVELQNYFRSENQHSNGEVSSVNHIVWRGCKKCWAPIGDNKGSYTRVVANTGHWGPNVYDGVGAVRRGQYAHMRECNYQQADNSSHFNTHS